MKVLVIVALTAVCVSSRSLLIEDEWQKFKSTHGKFYRSLLDEQKRYSIFQENLRKIEEHNALYEKGLKTYELGITPFADLNREEFKEMLTLKKSENSERKGRTLFKVPENIEIPGSIDWREKGAVTSVKDQGECGACWAFSVTGSLEGQYYRKYNKLVSLSEQQLIDCAGPSYGTDGCGGGQFDPAFSYIRENGIEEESTYPYEMVDDLCKYDNRSIVTKLQDYVDVEPNDEDALIAAVGLVGPVSVAIDAVSIQFYIGGIYQSDDCSQTQLNHGVLAVGYGSRNGHDYWIIKNSWGKLFGQDGYMYMKRGINQCGIALQPSYPVL